MNKAWLEVVVDLCSTTDGRDRLMRLIQNVFSFLMANGRAKQLKPLAAQLSATRTLLRFFDNIPLVVSNIQNGIIHIDKKDWVISSLRSLAAVNSQVFYPVDHILFLFDHGVVGSRSSSLRNDLLTVSLLLWLSTSLTVILTNLLSLWRSKFKPDNKDRTVLFAGTVRFSLDAVLAYHWLPRSNTGITPRTASAMGVLSSLLALALHINSKRSGAVVHHSPATPPTK